MDKKVVERYNKWKNLEDRFDLFTENIDPLYRSITPDRRDFDSLPGDQKDLIQKREDIYNEMMGYFDSLSENHRKDLEEYIQGVDINKKADELYNPEDESAFYNYMDSLTDEQKYTADMQRYIEDININTGNKGRGMSESISWDDRMALKNLGDEEEYADYLAEKYPGLSVVRGDDDQLYIEDPDGKWRPLDPGWSYYTDSNIPWYEKVKEFGRDVADLPTDIALGMPEELGQMGGIAGGTALGGLLVGGPIGLGAGALVGSLLGSAAGGAAGEAARQGTQEATGMGDYDWEKVGEAGLFGGLSGLLPPGVPGKTLQNITDWGIKKGYKYSPDAVISKEVRDDATRPIAKMAGKVAPKISGVMTGLAPEYYERYIKDKRFLRSVKHNWDRLLKSDPAEFLTEYYPGEDYMRELGHEYQRLAAETIDGMSDMVKGERKMLLEAAQEAGGINLEPFRVQWQNQINALTRTIENQKKKIMDARRAEAAAKNLPFDDTPPSSFKILEEQRKALADGYNYVFSADVDYSKAPVDVLAAVEDGMRGWMAMIGADDVMKDGYAANIAQQLNKVRKDTYTRGVAKVEGGVDKYRQVNRDLEEIGNLKREAIRQNLYRNQADDKYPGWKRPEKTNKIENVESTGKNIWERGIERFSDRMPVREPIDRMFPTDESLDAGIKQITSGGDKDLMYQIRDKYENIIPGYTGSKKLDQIEAQIDSIENILNSPNAKNLGAEEKNALMRELKNLELQAAKTNVGPTTQLAQIRQKMRSMNMHLNPKGAPKQGGFPAKVVSTIGPSAITAGTLAGRLAGFTGDWYMPAAMGFTGGALLGSTLMLPGVHKSLYNLAQGSSDLMRHNVLKGAPKTDITGKVGGAAKVGDAIRSVAGTGLQKSAAWGARAGVDEAARDYWGDEYDLMNVLSSLRALNSATPTAREIFIGDGR